MNLRLPRIQIIQHVPFEGPAYISQWIKEQKLICNTICLNMHTPIPSSDQFDWLIIMGGPMSVNDEDKYPWLSQEKKIIEESLQKGKKIIGFCLGAQLIAQIMGAKIHHRKSEIGWFPVYKTAIAQDDDWTKDFPENHLFFHWHSDQFDIPNQTIHLLKSECCPNQAFRFHSQVFAFQFHPEMESKGTQALVDHCETEINNSDSPYIQKKDQLLNGISNQQYGHLYLQKILNKLLMENK